MKTNKKTDFELVTEFLNGNQNSIEILITRHKDKVYTYIFLLVKNQELAEDLFQDTFIKVIKSLHAGKYQDNGKFISWVIRIAHNLVIDYFRKENQLKVTSNDSCEYNIFNSQRYSDKTIEEELIGNQITKDIRLLIDELPEDQKEVIILRHFIGLSFKEIAEHTGVSINTALGRMRYALINLRKLIEKNNLSLTAK